jgi:hypothetical protein
LAIVAKYKQSILILFKLKSIENNYKFWGKYVRKLRIDRDTTTWKIQGELGSAFARNVEVLLVFFR